MSALPVALLALCFGMGVVGLGTAMGFGPGASLMDGSSPDPDPDPAPERRTPAWRTVVRAQAPRWALAVGLGVIVGLMTGWPVAVPLVAVAVLGVPGLFRQTAASASIVKIEAIAVWTEMLQGTLAASAGLTQAIVATAPLSPPPISDATQRLSARLSTGVPAREALLNFADDLADPSADRVVCALLLAVSSRALRLGDLLLALADTTRDEVALRLRIETSRSAVRSGVRTVLVFSLVFAGGLALVARSYLAPFGSAEGQLVLALVGLLYATGLSLMVSLARPPAPVRLLGRDVVDR
jgi:Flp pilus assembly protein TadB